MATKCLESVSIESNNVTVLIPLGANYFATKRGRCILAHVNPHPEERYRPIPEGARGIQFPEFRRHGDRYIDYGQPIFYDNQGNSIKP